MCQVSSTLQKFGFEYCPLCHAGAPLAFRDPKSCMRGEALSIYSGYSSVFIHVLR